MKENLNIEDCKELLYMLINQAISDYVHLFATKNRKERKALYTAEGFLFDDNYTIDWDGADYSLSDLLLLINEEDRTPIDIDAMRKQIRLTAYEHNFIEDKIKKAAQLRLDFLGVRRDHENG